MAAGPLEVELDGVSREQATELRTFLLRRSRDVGGAEANVAAVLAQLGHDVEMLSVLPQSGLGDLCEGELRRVGVGTATVRRLDAVSAVARGWVEGLRAMPSERRARGASERRRAAQRLVTFRVAVAQQRRLGRL